MRTVILKYARHIDDEMIFNVPKDAKVVHVGVQTRGHLTLWAEVGEENMREVPKEIVYYAFGTGMAFDRSKYGDHVKTVVDGIFIWHIYAAKEN